jgi:hypothetical protein
MVSGFSLREIAAAEERQKDWLREASTHRAVLQIQRAGEDFDVDVVNRRRWLSSSWRVMVHDIGPRVSDAVRRWGLPRRRKSPTGTA